MENGFIIDVIMRTERLVKDQQTIFHREARFSDIEIFRNNGTTLMGGDPCARCVRVKGRMNKKS